MNSSKIPIKLVWQLLGKIFEDLNLNDLMSNHFKSLEINTINCYELFYGITLKLLLETTYLHKGLKEGVTEDLYNTNIDKTIINNTLYNCQVYGSKYEYVWNCKEHDIFLKVLSICKKKSSKEFLKQKQIKDAEEELMKLTGVSIDNLDLSLERALSNLKIEYDFETDTLNNISLMKRKESIYLNLCRFAKVILVSESITTDLEGNKGLNYHKVDWYIIQQYCVREIWNVINRQKWLVGKKHRLFQPTIYIGKAQSLRPDAIYIFDRVGIRDCIVDIKLYGKSCLDSNKHYRYKNELNKSLSYQTAYPKYIENYKDKKSRKEVTFEDVNNWIIHFRRKITSSEKEFNGSRVYEGFANIGIFIIDMSDDCDIKYLDEQIDKFVNTYILDFNMVDREMKFKELLKEYGVSKCYIGDGFSFDDEYPNGTIYVDVDSNKLYLEMYKLFTEDKDGLIGDEQSLLITYDNFDEVSSNYSLEV